ncbi:pilus assembly protein [Corallococcus exercitus]|uniref:pilus assembly protein n=1 Tax=Corallococcus exercitus TaxID=2316736 RepID=UPI0035D4E46F
MNAIARGPRSSRGQSIVEAAIGVTLFITVLIFGIHFAEVGFLSLKVQEAAISALWDGTHGQMHNIPATYGEAHDSMRDAAQNAQGRYADFNGLSRVDHGNGITQVFTRGTGMRVSCEQNGAVDWAGALVTQLVYRDEGGTACNAQASLSAWNIPRTFLDKGTEGGLYKEQHLADVESNLQVCAVGRAVGGQCNSRFSMLVDDWGLSNEVESATCLLFQDKPFPCTNVPFYLAAHAVYEPTAILIPRHASRLVMEALFWNPLPPLALKDMEATFWMSAAGEETHFIQIPPPLMDPISMTWPTSPGSIAGYTSPGYGLGYADRTLNGGCFLGKDCD